MHFKTGSVYLACLLSMFAFTCLPASAMDQPRNGVVEQSIPKPRIDKDMRLALQQFVTRYALHPKNASQHIHIANVKIDSGETAMYAYWKEDQSILIMHFFAHPSEEQGLLWLHHKARIDLKTGVVATEEEMSGSNYLVTKAWGQHVVNVCLEHGQLLVLKPKTDRK